ncbi:hypothetical protein N5C38_08555 [Pseudomonas chengduensis]|nr:hypothetical protein [Pseudomonas chengduensis]MDH1211104.1 hypothetical protein [Pseudomonas chengduensis]
MSAFPITAKKLAVRLGTVARDLDVEPDAIELFASIAGVRIPLHSTTFQVDEDGTLLFLNGFEGFLDAMRAEMKEMEQCLQNESQRYNELWLRLESLTAASNQLADEVAVMCEAYSSGDLGLARSKLADLTERYVKNLKPAGGRVH